MARDSAEMALISPAESIGDLNNSGLSLSHHTFCPLDSTLWYPSMRDMPMLRSKALQK
jgi:hypothetical protein